MCRLSWFIVYFVFVVCLTLVTTGVLYGLNVFQKSNVGIIYLLLILYDLSVLMLAFLMTPFFDKARVGYLPCKNYLQQSDHLHYKHFHFGLHKVAGIFGAMAIAFLNLFYYIQVATGDATPTWLYWILALISPTGFALGMDKVRKCKYLAPTNFKYL